MFTWSTIQGVSSLEPKDIRFVLLTLLDSRTSDKSVTSGEALCLLVYDLLTQLGFKQEHCSSIVKHYKESLYSLGRMLEGQKHVPMAALSLMDNRFSALMGMGKDKEPSIYDFIEMDAVERVPIPVLSVSIVLPRLYQRALKAATVLGRLHSKAGDGRRPEVVDGAGLECTRPPDRASEPDRPNTP
jgi:hypothetical protein